MKKNVVVSLIVLLTIAILAVGVTSAFPCEPPPPPPSGEARTPGYWKNHLRAWEPTGYCPTDKFEDIFGIDCDDMTLLEALKAKGGDGNGIGRLARHGTAALLNAAHPGIDYPLTVEEVIAAVQAGDADTLEEMNESK